MGSSINPRNVPTELPVALYNVYGPKYRQGRPCVRGDILANLMRSSGPLTMLTIAEEILMTPNLLCLDLHMGFLSM